MKRVTVCADAGAEVGLSLVPGPRSLVVPGVARAPRIAAPAPPESAHLRFRLRGLHVSVAKGHVSWRSCIRGVPGSVCMPAASPPVPGSRSVRKARTTVAPTHATPRAARIGRVGHSARMHARRHRGYRRDCGSGDQPRTLERGDGRLQRRTAWCAPICNMCRPGGIVVTTLSNLPSCNGDLNAEEPPAPSV
jgi:hypothetical protein